MFMVPGRFLWFQVGISWFFMVSGRFSWFKVGFSWFQVGFHVFMVPGWFFMVLQYDLLELE